MNACLLVEGWAMCAADGDERLLLTCHSRRGPIRAALTSGPNPLKCGIRVGTPDNAPPR